MTKNTKKIAQKEIEPKKKSATSSKNSKSSTSKEVNNKSIKLKVTEKTTASNSKAKSSKAKSSKANEVANSKKTSTLNESKAKEQSTNIKTLKDNKETKEKTTDIKPKKEKQSNGKQENKSATPKENLPEIISTSDYDLNKVELDFEHEVYDEADIASALEMGYMAQALEAHKAKVAKETHPDFDGESCIDCGEEIPQLRLSMGRIRCVYCQESLERKNKLHGR
jgi:RNA polymerase-binding transcription factor DksA